MVTLDRRRNLHASKILLSSLLLSLLLGLSVSAEQEIRLDLEENAGPVSYTHLTLPTILLV